MLPSRTSRRLALLTLAGAAVPRPRALRAPPPPCSATPAPMARATCAAQAPLLADNGGSGLLLRRRDHPEAGRLFADRDARRRSPDHDSRHRRAGAPASHLHRRGPGGLGRADRRAARSNPRPPALSLLPASEPARLMPVGLLLALVGDHHEPASTVAPRLSVRTSGARPRPHRELRCARPLAMAMRTRGAAESSARRERLPNREEIALAVLEPGSSLANAALARVVAGDLGDPADRGQPRQVVVLEREASGLE
jgi:hypothetical protein